MRIIELRCKTNERVSRIRIGIAIEVYLRRNKGKKNEEHRLTSRRSIEGELKILRQNS